MSKPSVEAKDLYPIVFDFLSKCGNTNTAKIFLKETGMTKTALESKEDLISIYSSYKV